MQSLFSRKGLGGVSGYVFCLTNVIIYSAHLKFSLVSLVSYRLHELCLTLMDSKESSYATFLNSQEEELYDEWLENSDIYRCRCILHKRKFLAYLKEDMDAAAQFLEMGLQFPTGANARMSNVTIGTFIDGLVAFFFSQRRNIEGFIYYQR